MSSLKSSKQQAKKSVKATLTPLVKQVDKALDGYLPGERQFPAKLNQAMRYSMFAGGKRLRPVLTLLTCDMLGGKRADALPAACAVEMIHTYSLIHDDLPAMDDDDMRRGRPTLHVAFDEAMAILAGDGLLTLAFDTISEHQAPADTALACIQTLSRAAGYHGMVGGQVLDMASHSKASLSRVKTIHRKKTAALIQASIVMGAHCAQADNANVKAMRNLGESLGLAFQIADDVLDIESNAKTLGKTVGKDIAQDKATYPAAVGLRKAKAEGRKLIEEALGILENYGPAAAPLKQLARYIVERKA